jgi:hypothetical protein
VNAIHKHLRIALVFLALLLFNPISAQTSNDGARKFDEFGDAQLSDIAARLDNFANALQNEPQMKGFLIVYRSRRDLPGLSSSLVAWLKNYLVYNRGFSLERIIAVDGGVAARGVSQELWLVPPGATPTPRSDAYTTTFEDTNSPRKFYEAIYYATSFSPESYSFDISNSFEGFSEALRREPRSWAYLIAYTGYRIEKWEEYNDEGRVIKHGRRKLIEPIRVARKQLARDKAILVNEYRIPASRIKVIYGGYREAPIMELWIVPRGQHAPIPTPNRFPKRKR